MGMLYELDEVEKAGLLDAVLQRARADLNDGRPLTEMRHEHEYRTIEGQSVSQCDCGAVRDYGDIEATTKRNLLADMKDDQHVTSLTTVAAAILDTIDAGCHHADGFTHEWKFNAFEEDFANAQRERFVDAVAQRVRELQGEPHGYDAVLLAKLRDVQANYQVTWTKLEVTNDSQPTTNESEVVGDG